MGSDWVRDKRMSWLWPAAFVAVGAGWLVMPHPGGSLLAATGFGVAGGLCVANAVRCRRTHCIVTGPLYLLAALLFLFRLGGMAIPAGLIVATSIVGTIFAYIPEWFGLRYVLSRRRDVMPTVELLYDKECPNVAEARANLKRAFATVGLSPSWTERGLLRPRYHFRHACSDRPPYSWTGAT